MRFIVSSRVALTCVLFTFIHAISTPVGADPAADETRHVHESDNLTIVCNGTGPTNLTEYYWTKDDAGSSSSVLYSEGQTLVFIDISAGESGTYTCHALDNVTVENVTVMTVEVDVQSPETSDDNSTLVYIVIGCSAAGVFVLLLFWSSYSRRRQRTYRFAGTDSLGKSLSSQPARSLKSLYRSHSKSLGGSSFQPHDGYSQSSRYGNSSTFPYDPNSTFQHEHSLRSQYGNSPMFHHSNSSTLPHGSKYTPHLGGGSTPHLGGGSTPQNGASVTVSSGNSDKPQQDTSAKAHGESRPQAAPFGSSLGTGYGSTSGEKQGAGVHNPVFKHDY